MAELLSIVFNINSNYSESTTVGNLVGIREDTIVFWGVFGKWVCQFSSRQGMLPFATYWKTASLVGEGRRRQAV